MQQVKRLFGGGDSADASQPTVSGTVRACYVADEQWPGHEVQADPHFSGHYIRQRAQSLSVVAPTAANGDISNVVPPSHRGLALRLRDPNERALMMSTVEGYERLRAALPFAAGTLSHERPGSGENFYVDGLAQAELCIGTEARCPLSYATPSQALSRRHLAQAH